MSTKNKKPLSGSQKMKLKQLRRAVDASNRATRRENKAFQALKPADKRVYIARDVLAQIAIGRLKATPGVWLGDSKLNDGSDDMTPLLTNEDALKNRNVEVQSVLKKMERCDGCALGGMFMCAVERADKLKVKDLLEFKLSLVQEHNENYDNSLAVGGDDAFNYLRKFFSVPQLKMIECAFERGQGAYHNSTIAVQFALHVDDPNERMKLIMQNIIVNKGTFCPDKQLPVKVTYWTIPGFQE